MKIDELAYWWQTGYPSSVLSFLVELNQHGKGPMKGWMVVCGEEVSEWVWIGDTKNSGALLHVRTYARTDWYFVSRILLFSWPLCF